MGDLDLWALELVRAGVELDLRMERVAAPRFLAAAGATPLLHAELRPFPDGRYHEPLIELMALAIPLGADRVAVGMTGRVTSLDDPIPPVLDGVGDLRQRALVLELIDAHHQPASNRSLLLPFEVGEGTVSWGEVVDPGPAEGWIPQALAFLLDRRHDLPPSPGMIAEQTERCLSLGHRLAVMAEAAARIEADAADPR